MLANKNEVICKYGYSVSNVSDQKFQILPLSLGEARHYLLIQNHLVAQKLQHFAYTSRYRGWNKTSWREQCVANDRVQDGRCDAWIDGWMDGVAKRAKLTTV